MINSLYTQSVYSFNGSVIKLEDLIDAMKLKSKYVALADQNLHGAMKFFKLAFSNGLKPIIGLETNLESASDMPVKGLIYARKNKGYQALLKLSSLFHFKGVITHSDIKPYENDLSVFIIIKKDENDMTFHQYKDLKHVYFKEDFSFTKVHRLLSHPESFEKVMKQIMGANESIEGCLEDQMIEMDEPFLAGHVIEDNFLKSHLPKFKTPDHISSFEYLKALSEKGLKRRLEMNPKQSSPYFSRLEKELKVLQELNYEDYFLIVWDILKEARKKNILVGPGRGSAPGSLVAYSLGITHIDPLEHGLLFERFLNAARKTMPDIDIDFPDDKRELMLSYLSEKYGNDHVALISTFGTFLFKSALRDSARVLNIDAKRVKNILDISKNYSSVKALIEDPSIKDWMQRHESIQLWLKSAYYLEGCPKHVSTHAAGIVLSDKPLYEYTAIKPGLYGLSQTMFEQSEMEAMGVLKIDLLGLRNLTLIQKMVDKINTSSKKPLMLNQLSLEDQKTFKQFQVGSMNGIFQLESRGMRRLIKDLKVSAFKDIALALALYRPGPMESISTFLKRRNQKEMVPKIHPIIDEILKDTEGILIYQEQIMAIATDFAGYSLEEADLLRRGVSKKDRNILEKEEKLFVQKAIRYGQDEHLAKTIYAFIVKFADYGFNKSHSVAYAMIAYWMMYIKARYPHIFLSVMMAQALNQPEALLTYINEAKTYHIDIRRPSILQSSLDFVMEGHSLIFPLSGIKNIGKESWPKFLELKKHHTFDTFVDFIIKTDSIFNTRQVQYLIYSGALDDFKETHQTMIENLDAIKTFSKFNQDSQSFKLSQYEEYPLEILEKQEVDALTINITYHINQHYQTILKHPDIYTLEEAYQEKGTLRFIARISRIKELETKTKETMAFLELKGQFITMDAVMFPELFKTHGAPLLNHVYLFLGQFQYRQNKWQITLQNLKEIPPN